MKKISHLALTMFIVMAFTGCKETITDRYYVNTPVYMDSRSFKKAVKVTASEDIVKPGKIYFKDHYIFINEALKGIHVIDNTNPADPVFVAFIEIPGNVDMAVKDSILYADSFIDLVALDISDIYNIKEVGRVDSIFPYALPPIDDANGLPVQSVDPAKGIVVGWETRLVEENIKTGTNFTFLSRDDLMMAESGMVNSKVTYTDAGSGSMSIGVGGSMARFTIYRDFLYTVDQYNLKTFDIDELSSPLLVSDQSIGWGVETIFQYHDKLFFGTQTGMIIFDLNTPSRPGYISTYNHIRSCDPVVVDGSFAYVTLRAGNLCGEATSQLDVIDVSDITDPKWKQSYPMQEPYGLGIDDNTLFVCDGPAGLKVYDASDPRDLQKIAWFEQVSAFDVIPYQGILMMIGEGGLYQYTYGGPDDISLLSQLPINSQGE